MRTHFNQSRVAVIKVGNSLSTSPMSLSFCALGSNTSTTMIFHSICLFVMIAMAPRTFTCLTWPTYPTSSPISHTPRGLLSPFALVSEWNWRGSCHVCVFINVKHLILTERDLPAPSDLPEGARRSSRCNHGEESSSARIVIDLSSRLA